MSAKGFGGNRRTAGVISTQNRRVLVSTVTRYVTRAVILDVASKDAAAEI